MKLIRLLAMLNEELGPSHVLTGGMSKREVESMIYTTKYFTRRPKRNEKVIALIGNPANEPGESETSVSAIMRHINNYENIGCKEKNIIFVENHEPTYRALLRAKEQGKPDGSKFEFELKNQDIREVVDAYQFAGIYLIDFDAMSIVNESSIRFLKKFANKNIAQYLIYVFSQRGSGAKVKKGPLNRDLLIKLSKEGGTPLVHGKEVNLAVGKEERERRNIKYDPKTKSDRPEPDTLKEVLGNWIMEKLNMLPAALVSYGGAGGGGKMLLLLLEKE